MEAEVGFHRLRNRCDLVKLQDALWGQRVGHPLGT